LLEDVQHLLAGVQHDQTLRIGLLHALVSDESCAGPRFSGPFSGYDGYDSLRTCDEIVLERGQFTYHIGHNRLFYCVLGSVFV
jgi:hypothetical protein